jgi:hypothetical protein
MIEQSDSFSKTDWKLWVESFAELLECKATGEAVAEEITRLQQIVIENVVQGERRCKCGKPCSVNFKTLRFVGCCESCMPF